MIERPSVHRVSKVPGIPHLRNLNDYIGLPGFLPDVFRPVAGPLLRCCALIADAVKNVVEFKGNSEHSVNKSLLK